MIEGGLAAGKRKTEAETQGISVREGSGFGTG